MYPCIFQPSSNLQGYITFQISHFYGLDLWILKNYISLEFPREQENTRIKNATWSLNDMVLSATSTRLEIERMSFSKFRFVRLNLDSLGCSAP